MVNYFNTVQVNTVFFLMPDSRENNLDYFLSGKLKSNDRSHPAS
jgi:hypothetical protein